MRSCLALLLMSLLGLTGCTKPIVIGKPYPCEPFHIDIERIEEYVALAEAGAAPSVRAWVRETDRVCRANNELRDG